MTTAQDTADNPIDWSRHQVWCIGDHGPRACERDVILVAGTGVSEPTFTGKGAMIPSVTVTIIGYPASPRGEPGWIKLTTTDPGSGERVELCLTSSEADELTSGVDEAIRLFRGGEVEPETALLRGEVDAERRAESQRRPVTGVPQATPSAAVQLQRPASGADGPVALTVGRLPRDPGIDQGKDGFGGRHRVPS